MTEGWSNEKRCATENAFYQFLNRCYINSKDLGRICLGEHLYQGQRDAITEIFDALEEGIHKIYILKSRQLGISTIIRALIIFLLGIHRGLKGAIVFDTDNNKTESRAEIEVMIEDLPDSLKFPDIKSTNRQGLTLKNDSKVLFMSAGVKKSKSSGALGRSVGLSLAHLSELCSYDNDDGLEAFENSLSDVNPDRLYIYESTARGYNKWWQLWKEARADTLHCKCIFLGWWSKRSQQIDRNHMDFHVYGVQAPTEKELEKIAQVRDQYGYEVTQEQLAWIRRKMDPAAASDEDEKTEYTGSAERIQEQPWTEEDAFQQTGAIFFAAKDLKDLTDNFASKKARSYMMLCGEEFADMKIYPAQNMRSTELKVWEEPAVDGCYVFGIDPAYGENDKNCNAVIEVLRCYADGWDQVAEYAWPLMTTRHLAWGLAALLGWYGINRNEARYILELNGPGEATFNEIRSLKFQIDHAKYLQPALEQKGLLDVFKNVRTYIYTRPDALGAGYNFHWKTTQQLKITILERLRDVASNGKGHIRSFDAIEEMRSIAREGPSIGAPGSLRDDRVIGLALANYYWETRIRPTLITQRRTRSAEEARQRLTVVDQVALFNQNNLEYFFAEKRAARTRDNLLLQRQAWRFGSHRRY